MAYYSLETRRSALDALSWGHTREEVRKKYHLGSHTLQDWEKLQKETGSLENRPLNRKPRKIDRDELREYYRNNPFAMDIEAAQHFGCTPQGIRDARKASKITRKKNEILQRARRGRAG